MSQFGLLREWIRGTLTEGLLTESGKRGFIYEKTLEAAFKNIPGFVVGDSAGNKNTVSDLGFSFYGKEVASEIKLDHSANLGAVSKDTIETLTFDATTDTFKYTVKSDPLSQSYKDIIKSAIDSLNAGTGPEQMKKLTDAIRSPQQPIDLADEIVLMGQVSAIGSLDSETGRTPLVDEFAKKWAADPDGMTNWITDDMKSDILFRVLKDQKPAPRYTPEQVAQLQLSPEHVAAGFKTLSQVTPGLNKTLMNSPVLTAAEVRKIMTRKKGPNGADTNYLITGTNQEKSVSGEIHHIGTDVLGLGTPLFEPASGNLEVRLKGGGSARKGTGTYGVQFSTKADPGPAGLKFNNAEELAAIFANARRGRNDLKRNKQPSKPTVRPASDQARTDREYDRNYELDPYASGETEFERNPYANLSDSLKRAVLKRLLKEAQKNQH